MKNKNIAVLIFINTNTILHSSFFILLFLYYLCTRFSANTDSEKFRRDGRVVDYNGLENRRTERYRGFESLSLR